MSVTTWILEPEEVKAAIELYMVEEQGVPLDDIRSIKIQQYDIKVEITNADTQTGGTERKEREE